MGTTVNIAGAINTAVDVYSSTSHSGGLLSSSTTKVNSTSNTQTISGTTLTGDTVNIASVGDTNILASNVVGSNGVSVTSTNGNVTIGGITTTDTASQMITTKKSGLSLSFSGGGVSLFAGVAKTSDTATSNSTTFNGSSIAALNGDVNLTAGKVLTVTGSQVLANTGTAAGSAPGTISLSGQSVVINNGLNTGANTDASKRSSVGITLSASSPLAAAVSTVVDMAKTVASTPNARVAATAGLAGGLAAYNGITAAQDSVTSLADDIKNNANLGDMVKSAGTVSATIGFSKSQSTSATTSQTVVGSQISGGNVNITATGAGAGSTIDVAGSSINASGNLTATAAGAINLSAAAANATQVAQNSSSGASLGVSFNATQGFAVTGAYNQGNGNSSGAATTYTAATLSAGNTATINSGGALTMNGAVVSGNTVDVTAKSLDITSRQDTSTFQSSNKNIGISVTVAQSGMVSGSVNAGFGNANDNYKSVTTQAGINAGSGGYNINVAGNTNLTGAVISSTADPSLNSLTTGTLTTSNLANSEKYSDNQTSLGVTLSANLGSSFNGSNQNGSDQNINTGTNGKAMPGVATGIGTIGATPPATLSASGGGSSTTFAAISPGTVTITSGDAASKAAAAQAQSNSTANSGALTQAWTPALQAQIAQGFAATQALTQQTSTFLANMATKHDTAQTTIGAYAKPVLDASGNPVTDAGGNPVYQTDAQGNYILDPHAVLPPGVTPQAANDALQAAQTTADGTATWGAGGTGRLVMTAITGAAGSNVTGSLSGLVQASAVTVLQGLATQQVKQIVANLETQNSDGTLSTNATSETVRTLLQGLVGCAGSAASGSGDCGAAAMGASASVVLNDLIAQAANAKNGNAAVDANGNPLTQAQQTATADLVSTLVAGIATGAGLNANAATTAAQVETLNNSIDSKGIPLANELEGKCSNAVTCYNFNVSSIKAAIKSNPIAYANMALYFPNDPVDVQVEKAALLNTIANADLDKYGPSGNPLAGQANIISAINTVYTTLFNAANPAYVQWQANGGVSSDVATSPSGNFPVFTPIAAPATNPVDGNQLAATTALFMQGMATAYAQMSKGNQATYNTQTTPGGLNPDGSDPSYFQDSMVTIPALQDQISALKSQAASATSPSQASQLEGQVLQLAGQVYALSSAVNKSNDNGNAAAAPFVTLLNGIFAVFPIGDTESLVTALAEKLPLGGAPAAAEINAPVWEIFNGKAMNPDLPPPEAGWDYVPKTLNDPNPNIANSQVNGYAAELDLANTVQGLPNQQVVSYGGAMGTHGADVVSVDTTTGEVILWDSKTSVNAKQIPGSTTFDSGSAPLNNAVNDAKIAIENSNLPPDIQAKALGNLKNGNFTSNTVGSGAIKNSVSVKSCNWGPC